MHYYRSTLAICAVAAGMYAGAVGCQASVDVTTNVDDGGFEDGGVVPGVDAGVPGQDAAPASDAGGLRALVNRTDLVADNSDLGAAMVDSDLVNPWGIAFNPNGNIWIANNHSGTATIYTGDGAKQPLVVTIPAPSGPNKGAPTGQIFNLGASFEGDLFIFVTEDGTVVGWQTGPNAIVRVNNSENGAIYKGLTVATVQGSDRLYLANFHAGRVEMIDAAYKPIMAPDAFIDPNLPAGYAPFNVQAIGDRIFVSYALQDQNKEDDVAGPGNGLINVFDLVGRFDYRLATGDALNAPWAMAMAPADFGGFGNLLLVGNFGDGLINAFDPKSGAVMGMVTNGNGQPLIIDGLWALAFGNDTAKAAHNQLFFTAGPSDEEHGVFGRLDLAQ